MSVLYLCGAGNAEGIRLALRVNRARARWDRIVLLDDDASKHGQSVVGVEIAGGFDMLEQADAASDQVVNLVARTTPKRLAARHRIELYNLPWAALISPDVDTTGTEISRDAVVFQNATVGAESSMDDGSVVLMGAILGHGSRLGPGCIVAPNAVINARVNVEEGVYIGTNASILPELTIGAWATIASGSAVMKDVPAGATVMGVPGKVIMAAKDKPNLRAYTAQSKE